MRKTYDVLVSGHSLNFETKEGAERWCKESTKFAGCRMEIVPRMSKDYSLGEMWRDDFDYEGMVRMGAKADTGWGIKSLQKLFNSYEDVNYHTESEPLWEAIRCLEAGNETEAKVFLRRFRAINRKLLHKW